MRSIPPPHYEERSTRGTLHQNETLRLEPNTIWPTETANLTIYKHLITTITLTVYSNRASSDVPCILKSNIMLNLKLTGQ